MMSCRLCKKKFLVISNTHLHSKHNTSIKAYKKRFGSNRVGFLLQPHLLPKQDPRFKKWHRSLSNRSPWNKGYTKDTNSSVAKISKTFQKKKINNFKEWRELERRRGRLPQKHLSLKKDRDLAFLIGMVLGDGHISEHARTECLRITLGTDKPDLWRYTAAIVEKVFRKKPHVMKVKGSACMKITIYQTGISKRLGVPAGARGQSVVHVPRWILKDDEYIVRYLRGLYEAEGSFCVHRPTYTYKFLFSNKNESLLRIAYRLLQGLGFHPHRSPHVVQVSKKDEVYRIKELLKFRQYENIAG